jgi:hypothetical protein
VTTVGLLDKVKESASAAAAATKEAAQKGQAKLDEIQATKAADSLLRDLGAAAYAQQRGRGTATTDADIEAIVGALDKHEAEHGPINLALTSGVTSPAPPPYGTATNESPPPSAESG